MGLLEELAVRCEAAKTGSRELDMKIKAAVYGGVALVSPFNGEWCLYRDGTEDPRSGKPVEQPRSITHAKWRADSYTTSLDAARSIWTEWDHCEVYRPDHQTLGWTVHLYGNANAWRGSVDGFAPTEAAAWTAASLRALALSKGSEGC